MAKREIGTKLELDGESEFKRAIAGINTNLTVLGSELGKVSAQFESNAESMDSLKAKQSVYNKQIDEQKNKIEKLKEALASATKEFGEGSKQSQNWQIALNKAEGSLAKTENALKGTTDKISSFGKEAVQTGRQVEKAGEQAKKSGDDAQKGESGWSKLGASLGKAGAFAGKAVLGFGTAVGVGMTAALGASLKATADIEQQLGGAEAVFEKNSDKIKSWAASAAGSMGMSANAALETANKMGSLFQGSGIEADAAAEMTMDMSQRAADVASVMGVDLAMAMEAVTGAAKGNYTMMDNLGVAMNDTTLNAYAQSKGIKTAWKEMTNAEKAGVAYQLFMEKTNKYAGNFAKENTSLAGSFDVLKGSFNNVLSSLSDPKMLDTAINQFVIAVSKVGDSVGAVLPKLLTGLATAITTAIPVLAPILIETVSSLVSVFIDAFTKYLPDIVSMGVDVIKNIVAGISNNLPVIIDAVVGIITMLAMSFVDMLPEIVKMGLDIIIGLANGITDSLPELIPSIVDTVLMIVETLIDNIDMLVDASVAIIVALSDGLIAALPRLMEKAPIIVMKLVAALINNIPKLLDAGVKLIMGLGAGLINAIPQLLLQIPKIIDSIVTSFSGYYSKIFDIGKNIVKGVWEGILSMATWLSSQVTGFFDGIVGDIKDSLGIHSPSKVFAGIGGNMALGLGKGFATEMDGVAKRINNSVPTSLNVNGASSGSQRNIIVQSPPIYLDGKPITSRTSFHQSNRNQTYSRALGRPVTV